MPSRLRAAAPKRGSHLVMVLPDLHIPHQDPAALSIALKAHALLKPARTVILGDWLDAEAFSNHPRRTTAEARAKNFRTDEIDPCNQILDRLQRNTKLLVFIAGNHEHRIERRCANDGDAMFAVRDYISPQHLLSRGRKSFKYIPYAHLNHYEITPDLWALHGWSAAKHAASVHLQRLYGRSVVYGHTHRAQSYVVRDPGTDKVIKAWSPGVLAALQPLYMTQQPTDWAHGFSLIYVKNDLSRWSDYTVTIEHGAAILPCGKEIKA